MNTNNHSASHKKSRGAFIIVAVIAALAVLGLLLSQMDGRVVIVSSADATATSTAGFVSNTVTAAAQSTEAPESTSTVTPKIQGERLQMCGSDICIVSADGQTTPFGLETDYEIRPGFGFSPDGSKIVFNACLKTEVQQNPTYAFCNELLVADRNGSVSRLTNTYNIPESHPAWSPDGKWIAVGGWALEVIQPDGTGATTLISDPNVGNVSGIAWSPNSEQIAFIVGIYDFTLDWGFQNEIQVINRDGSGWRKIFEFEAKPTQEDWITEIAWSPDGQSLAIAFHDGRAYSIDAQCEAGKEGCRLSDLNAIYEIPENWLDTFYPQWGNASAQPNTPTVLTSQAEQARAFAEPILQAIADRPPDFEDDFSTDSYGWQIDTFEGRCGQIADGRLALSIIPERMTPQQYGRYTCGAHNPSVLNVTNFVFEIDLTQTQSEIQGVTGVQWRHTSDGHTPDGYYRVAVDMPGNRWWTLANSSISLPGGFEMLQDWQGPASGRIRVIGRGSQFAVYINETSVFYLEDDLNPSGEIDLLLTAGGLVTVEYDNVKLWNLDNVPGLP